MHDSSLGRNAVEVLAEEFVNRYRSGERPPLSEYTGRFPDIADEIRDLFPAMLMMENLKPADESGGAHHRTQLELSQLGDYRIIREVGRGGMGVVYEAEQISLGRHVALKVLPREMVADSKQRLRFEREAKAAAKLHHTNIVPVFGVGDSDGQLYYVMQFIQGLALDDVLDELKRLKTISQGGLNRSGARDSQREVQDVSALDMARSILIGSLPQKAEDANADGFAGQATCIISGRQSGLPESGLVDSSHSTGSHSTASHSTISGKHSDTFSHANSSVVLPKKGLDSSGKTNRKTTYCESIAQIGVQVGRALDYAHSQGILHRDIKPANLVLDLKGTVWVTDFGLAKLDDERGLTQAGDILGTLRYMSPESFKGQSDVRSEVYSLGLTLYEMLAFRPAFDQSSRAALIDQVMSAQVGQLTKINPEIPRDLQTIIHKSIDRIPEHRYQSAGELADDLQRFLDDQPIKARRVSLSERLLRWSRHNKSLAASLSAVMLLVSVLAVGSTIAAGYFQTVNSELSKTVGKLTDTTNKLTGANLTALKATKESNKSAAENLKLAQDARQAVNQANTMLADMQTERGLKSAEQGDYATAMLWFANAAGQAQHDPQRQLANRQRARNAMSCAWMPVALMRHTTPGLGVRIAFQPQGELLTSLNAYRLQIWNWRLEQSLRWADELQDVTAAAWAPDGTQIAIGLGSGNLQVRTIPSGEVVQSWAHPSRIESLAFSRDGRQLAVGGDNVQVWDVSSEPRLFYQCPHPQPVHSLTFNRDGTRLATACRDHLVRLFALDAKPSTDEHPETASQSAIELAPLFPPVSHAPLSEGPPVFVEQGRRLVTIHSEDRIGYWDTETGAAVEFPSGQGSLSGAHEIVVSNDENWFAVVGNAPGLWSVRGQHYPLAHANHMRSATFSPDGKVLATGCDDWISRLWQLPPTAASLTVVPQLEPVLQCAFSDDGLYMAASGDDVIRIWKRPDPSAAVVTFGGWEMRHPRPRPSFDQRWVTLGAWHETPNVSPEITNTLSIIEAATGHPAGPPIAINNCLDSCICGDNRSVAVISRSASEGSLSIYDVATGRQTCATILLPGAPCSVAARPEQPDVAVLCRSGQIVVVNHRDGSRIRDITIPAWMPDANHARLTYTPDGKTLIALLPQNQLVVHDAQTGHRRFAPIVPPASGGGLCRTFAVSPDSHWLATAVNVHNAVQVWDLGTGKAVGESMPHPGDQYGIFTIAFSPDGRWVLSGNKDGRARLWDWRTGKLVCPPLQHPEEVFDVAFTRDGKHALTAVRHGTLRVWELQTGKMVVPSVDYPLPPQHSSATVAVVGDNAIVGAWHLPIISLSPLLAEPRLSTDALRTMAELATSRHLELGELSSLSDNEWAGLWAKSRNPGSTPQSLAESFARELDLAPDAMSRAMIAARAAKSQPTLNALARLRGGIPQVQAELARAQHARGNPTEQNFRDRAIELYEQQLKTQPNDQALATQLAELLLQSVPQKWKVLQLSDMKSRDGAEFKQRDDGSVIVSGNHTVADIYTLTTTGNGDPISAIRLEALTDKSLPGQGPGRHPSSNFQFSALQLFRTAAADESLRPVMLADAYASYSYHSPDVDVLGLIHPERHQIWHVWGRPSQPHQAVFFTEAPLTVDRDHPLVIRWQHNNIGEPINLGCFRLSASSDPGAWEHDQTVRDLRSGKYSGTLALAMTYMLIDRHEQARALLERVDTMQGEFATGIRWLLLTEIYERLKQPQASKSYEGLVAWLSTYRLPETFQHRAQAVMHSVGGLTPDQAILLSQSLFMKSDERRVTEQIKLHPQSAGLYAQRAQLFARIGKWREAASDDLRVTELRPGEGLLWMDAATAQLMAGDLDGYKATCRKFVTQFANSTELWAADVVCKTSLIVPDTIPLSELPTSTLCSAVDAGAPSAWCIASCSLVALREGHYQQAIDITKRLGEIPTGQIGALALVVRSMAQHNLQQLAAGRESLRQAELLIPVQLRTLGSDNHSSAVPVDASVVSHDWLIPELLRREAACLIGTQAKAD